MDNLPNNPPDQNNNSTPPPFGSNFNPHSSPVDPNNPYAPTPQPLQGPPHESIHSEVAQHRPRDAHGHFLPYEHPNLPQTPPAPQTAPTPPNPSSFLPPIIEINQNTKPSDKKDPPLFGFFLTNPVTYLKIFLNKLLKRQMITLRIPVLALIIIMVGIGGYGVGFKSGINYALGKLFPNFSPILHRSITAQGTIQKSTNGYYLQANDKDKTLWTLKPVSQNVNLADFEGMKAEVKGNLTPTPNLIEVSEVVSFETKPSPSPTTQTTPTLQTISNPAPSGVGLPSLYSKLTWEITQSKTLLFTSGKRRIEQEGVYLESSPVTEIPQDFIDYYTNQLTNLGFKQTLNSSEPNGITITYSKDDLFLTFGVKNIYQGKEEKRQIVGYKAYIEHN